MNNREPLYNLHNPGGRKINRGTSRRILNNFLRLLILIILARHFGPEGFGIVSFLEIFFFFFLIMNYFWIEPTLMRELNISRDNIDCLRRRRIIIGNGIIIRLLLALVTIAFLWVNTAIISHPMITEISCYVSISLVLMAFYFSSEMVLQLNPEGKNGIGNLVLRKILILGVIFFVIIFKDRFWSLYKLVLIPGALLLFWVGYSSLRLTKPILKIDFGLWRKIARNFKSMGLTAVFIFLYLFIRYFMLLYMKGFEQLGSYCAASNLVEGLSIFLIPLVSYLSLQSRRYRGLGLLGIISRAYRFRFNLLLLIIPVAFMVMLFPGVVISAIYGKQFLSSYAAIAFLICAEGFVFLGVFNLFFSFAVRSQRMNFIFMAAAILINVFSTFFMIIRFGFIGVAIATFGSCAIWPNDKVILYCPPEPVQNAS